MLCHAYAFLPVSTNHSGTASRALSASPNAARNCSSSQLSAMVLVLRPVDIGEPGQRTGSSQSFQAAGSLRADASHRDLQLLADLRVRMRRVAHEHSQQLLVLGWKLRERRS